MMNTHSHATMGMRTTTTIQEEEEDECDSSSSSSAAESPQRFHGPQHENLHVHHEKGGDVGVGVEDSISYPRRPVRFAPDTQDSLHQHAPAYAQSRSRSQSTPLEEYFHHRREKVFYYRIVYRGVVALMAKPEAGSKKSGAYVSYGEIIASTKELYINMPQSPIKETSKSVSGSGSGSGNNNGNGNGSEHFHTYNHHHQFVASPKSIASGSGASIAAHSIATTTTSSLPLGPSQLFLPAHNARNLNSQSGSSSQSHNHGQNQNQSQNMERVVQVDEVLTGGYAIDASSAATSYTHRTPRRSNVHGLDGKGMHMYMHQHKSDTHKSVENHSEDDANYDGHDDEHGGKHKGISGSGNSGRRHHGFLCLHKNGIPIAESIPSPPLLCQAGRFYYRVTSLKPIPILTGPCADAPRTRAMALPGTVHEISLRMGSYHHGHGGNSNGALQDGVVYLRLSHRRGWIADRRFVTTLLQGMNGNVSMNEYHPHYQHHKSIIDGHDQGLGLSTGLSRPNAQNVHVEMEIVVKEVSDFVDISNIHICDDMSLGGTSISSASFATPASVIRTRRRPLRRHRREDQAGAVRVGMVVQHKSKTRRNKHAHGGGMGKHGSSPPMSDISMVSTSPTPLGLSARNNHESLGLSKRRTHHNDRGRQEGDDNEMGIQMGMQDHDHTNVAHARIKPDLYLMRVTATQGLKILDAPHFQVNRLIRGQGTGSRHRHGRGGVSSHLLGGTGERGGHGQRKKLDQYTHKNKNPSSIFHTMNGNSSLQGDISSKSNLGVGGDNGHVNHSWELDASGKYRILPRGALFEASKRMEKADNLHYAPSGSGLIKLADNTGWAIVPNRADLEEQLRMHQANGNAGLPLGMTEEEALEGFEEVGNACAVTGVNGRSRSSRSRHSYHVRQGDEHILWVRVVQQTGVFVSCAQSRGDMEGSRTLSSNPADHSHSSEDAIPSRHHDSDAVSTVSSAFFDAFRSTSRKSEARLDSLSVNTTGGNHRSAKFSSPKASANGPIIPCGACVKVKKWTSSNSQRENQSFVRITGSAGGWIPRIIHGVTYAVDIQQPDVRRGSFWFRVQPEGGVKVRIGPSERSPAIKSENGYFQFECGEYLRASEILTIHDHADIEESERDENIKVDHPSESFAKLYRNSHSSAREELASGNSNLNRKSSLDNLTEPGEWVHVHCNGHLYLEECVNPPSIERHPDGWRYEVSAIGGVDIRRGPSFSAGTTGTLLQHCASVLINEKVTASGEVLTWLRLKDGRGWVHNVGEKGESVMKSYATKKEAKPSVNKLISRLGLR